MVSGLSIDYMVSAAYFRYNLNIANLILTGIIMDREILLKASAQGIISKEQVEQLVTFDADVDVGHAEEQLRFVRSFGDIFITLGIIFVSIATAQFDISGIYKIIPVLVLVATTEWLVRVRRLALPGIALLIAMLYYSSQFIGLSEPDFELSNIAIPTTVAILFYWRYSVPFTLLPITLGLLSMLTVLLNIDIKQAQYFIVIYGLVVFVIAMWFDSRDVKRQSHLSDAAFWLHLLAAPLVVHGVMVTLLVETQSVPFRELLIILFFSAFFLVALYVDRRAILVSSISYAIYAIVELVKNNQIQIENMTLLIFVGFGVFIIVFGVYWYKIRTIIFSTLSDAKLSKYVPPIIR